MTVWRDVFIGKDVDPPALTRGLANAFGVDTARVAILAADEEWLTLSDGFEIVAETSPTCGEARLMATLFLFRNPAEVERVEDQIVVQALADNLGCTVLLPDEADMDPFNYLRFRPHVPVERVSLDPDGLDEGPTRVGIYGPYADLRRTFNADLLREKGLAGALDRASAAVGQYGADRTRAEAIAEARGDTAAIAARFAKLDAEIGKATSKTPGRKDGKSQMEELGEKAAELARVAVEAVKAAFRRTPAVKQGPAASAFPR